MNLLYNFCHISSIYWHLDVYINKLITKKCRATEVLFIIFSQWHVSVIIAQIQKQKLNPVLNSSTSLSTSTSFKITTNIFQPTTNDYMSLLPQVRTSLRSKYFSYSIMSYDFNYVSTSVDSPFKSRITKEIFNGYSFI